MTAAVTVARSSSAPSVVHVHAEDGRARTARAELPPLSPRMQLVRFFSAFVFALSFAMLLQLTVVSRLQHSSAQQRMFDSFRSVLAKGSAPIGPTDEQGGPLALGTPVAYLEIPTLGLREVVGEGTTAGVLFDGPGHRRDTVLPGQVGTSVVMARRAAFGGPFDGIAGLKKGARLTFTTAQGVYQYVVIGVRGDGAPLPPAPKAGSSRLVLVTAAGRPFLPSGLIRVDADLVGQPTGGPARLFTEDTLPGAERPLANDSSTMWALVMWLQALTVLCIGFVWAWHRWGRAQAWVVFIPLLLLVGLAVAGEVARLLPNLT